MTEPDRPRDPYFVTRNFEPQMPKFAFEGYLSFGDLSPAGASLSRFENQTLEHVQYQFSKKLIKDSTKDCQIFNVQTLKIGNNFLYKIRIFAHSINKQYRSICINIDHFLLSRKVRMIRISMMKSMYKSYVSLFKKLLEFIIFAFNTTWKRKRVLL